MKNKQIPDTALTNWSNYSNPDNIGSDHWFNTLIGQLNRIGYYLETKGNNSLLHDYGIKIENIATDLHNWKKSLKNDK